MHELKLSTARLELVAGSAALARAEISDRKRFAQLLGAEEPEAWPPPLNDEASMEWTARFYESRPDAAGWGMWYFLLRGDGPALPLAIGNGGFKGSPGRDGTVEIGYSLLEAHHGKGYATEAVDALLAWALSHPEVRRAIAHTLPDLRPSIRLLERCGFRLVGPGTEEGTILFELPREAYASARESRSAPPQ